MCVHAQVSLRGAIRVGWVNGDVCGFQRNFRLCLAASLCAYVDATERERQIKVGRQREKDIDRVRQRVMCCDSRFLLPNRSHSRNRCCKPSSQPCEDDKRMEVATGSRFNQTDLVPSSDLMTACNSHVKKCRQVVLRTPDPLNGP